MKLLVQQNGLRDLVEKIGSGARLTDSDALRLWKSNDLHTLGSMANVICQRKTADRASYIINRYINYSNYCILSCQFCAFARKKRDADGFEYSLDEIVQKAGEA